MSFSIEPYDVHSIHKEGLSSPSEYAIGKWNNKKIKSIESLLNPLIAKVNALSIMGINNQLLPNESTAVINKIKQTLSELKVEKPENYAEIKQGVQRKLAEIEARLGCLTSRPPLPQASPPVIESHVNRMAEGRAAERGSDSASTSELKFEAETRQKAREAGFSPASELAEITAGGVKQIRVLPQADDATGFGGENCGFHAIKNALIALRAPSVEDTSALFNDKKIFSAFYDAYCRPLLEGKEAGKRDASPPLVSAILENFLKDGNPPPELAAIQKLAKSSPAFALPVFNTTTSDGLSTGDLVMYIIDEQGFENAQKLYNFAKATAPCSMATIIGNQETKHWYTLVFSKARDGTVVVKGCDSMNNDHAILRSLSPLHKMSKLLLGYIKEPELFIRQAYINSTADILEREVGWTTDKERSELLLDSKPNADFTKDGLTNGSPKELKLRRLTEAFDFMHRHAWFTSLDVKTQGYVANVETLLAFYAENLGGEDVQKAKMRDMLAILQGERPHDCIQKMVEAAEAYAKSQEEPLKKIGLEQAFQNTMLLIEGVKSMLIELPEIAKLTSTDERNRQFNKETAEKTGNALGAEGVLFVGKTPAEVHQGVMEKINTFLRTFQSSQSAEKFPNFCKEVGGGCLTGKLMNVINFATARELGEIKVEREDPYMAAAFAISQMIENDPLLTSRETITVDDFSAADRQRRLAESFSNFCHINPQVVEPNDHKKNFLAYLEELNLIASPFSVDWDAVVPNLVRHPSFATMLEKAKMFL